jgi:hypothetical protein
MALPAPLVAQSRLGGVIAMSASLMMGVQELCYLLPQDRGVDSSLGGGILEDRALLTSRQVTPNADDRRAKTFQNVTLVGFELTDLRALRQLRARPRRLGMIAAARNWQLLFHHEPPPTRSMRESPPVMRALRPISRPEPL